MATIKSYTDLSQSRKLAQILPLESADMYYEEVCNLPKAIFGNYSLHNQCMMEDKDYKKLSNPVLSPAWSLATLLGVLPKNLNIGRPSLDSNYKGYYWIQYYDKFMKPNNYKTECYDNPVDACYEMILKLHELNLL
jgi:hypothetical protein